MFLIIAKACDNCGGELAVKIQQAQPSGKEIDELASELGGMFCIRSRVIEVIEDKITHVEEL
jgi:hypothetical protein